MRNRHFLWMGICLLLALIPIINMVSILATTGVDTISNDYLMFIQQADRFLNGQNEWYQYFRDTLYTGVHSYAVLFPLRLLLLRLSNMSVFAEIAAGMLLALLRLGLFYYLLTAFLPENRTPWYRSPYLWLLPCLSALVFANAQVSTFSYGETILQFGMTQSLVLLGLVLLLKHPGRAASAWGAALCGILASFSGGSGLAAWPLFLLALLWTNRRSLHPYAAWLVGLCLACWPYLAYSSFNSPTSFQRIQLERLLVSLGLPFANHINYGLQSHLPAFWVGLLGLGMAGVSLALLAWRKRQVFDGPAIPAVLMMAWSLILIFQIMLARSMIAPWYTTSFSLFWIGLLGLLPLLIGPRWSITFRRLAPSFELLLPGWSLGVLSAVLVLYALTNLTFEDKSFYLASRSPASAACLRSYLDAPTYCEVLVFQWAPGNPTTLQKAAEPLARNRLSVLGPDQEWTLQGDYGLGRVHWQPNSDLGRVSWVRGSSDQPARWNDYFHLAVLIPPGQAIHWQVDLPAGVESAQFITELSHPAGASCTPGADTGFTVALQDERDQLHPLKRVDSICQLNGSLALKLDLSAFTGRVTLMLTTAPGAEGAPAARLNYPRLQLRGIPAAPAAEQTARPLNTDLSPDFPSVDGSAYQLAVSSENGWQFDQMTPTADGPAGRYRKSDSSTSAHISFSTPVCLNDWSQFYIKAAMADALRQKWVQVQFHYQLEGAQAKDLRMDLPLLPGEDLRVYSLNLDLEKFPLGACITSADLIFYAQSENGPEFWVELPEAGFLPRIHK